MRQNLGILIADMRQNLGVLSENFIDTMGIFSGITGIISVIGGAIISALGGWDYLLRTLFVFMCVDYITGIILAAVFKGSPKSQSGALKGCSTFMGFFRKGMMLLIVLIAFQLDNIIGWDFIRHAVIIAFLMNELISITENVGLMGVPIPSALQKAIEILKKKGD